MTEERLVSAQGLTDDDRVERAIRPQRLAEYVGQPAVREQLHAAACTLTRAVGYRGLCTVEFLLDEERGDFVFMEANPRIQVEHTVTEAVTGLDLAVTQIQLAAGKTLAELGLTQADMAADLEVSASYIALLERSRH